MERKYKFDGKSIVSLLNLCALSGSAALREALLRKFSILLSMGNIEILVINTNYI